MALFSKKQSNLPGRRRQDVAKRAERSTDIELEQRYTFKRNRTLTGSASSKVASTGESKADLKSPRVQAHELTRQRRHIGVVLAMVLLCSFILYSLISQFTAGVVVKAQEASLKIDSNIETVIQSYLGSRPIERLRFLMDGNHFNEYVQAQAPEVAAINVDGSAGFGKSAFIVQLREPIAGWSIKNKQQYVDATGASFSRNYFASPSLQIIDNSGVQVEAGQAIASNRFLGFVGLAVGLAKAQGYKVTQVIIPQGTTRQIELRLDGIGYPVKLSVDRAAGEQIEDMDRAVRWFSSKGQSPQYVDVRVSGKAFYR